jgi:hypothetical protein
MDSERELKCLAAVWALRGILPPEGFQDFKLKDGLVGWDKEDLEELLDYVKAKETPATVQLLSTNSRTTLEKVVNAVNLTRNGRFFKNLAQLGDLLKLTEAERDVPIIDKNGRGKGVIPMAPHEAARYRERSVSERFNGRLKEDCGAGNVRVRGAEKVRLHLMFGVIALFADQLLKLIS